MKKIIDVYIFREIALPFMIVLFILTFVLLMGKILQLMDLMINKGVNVLHVALFVFYILPALLLFTIPISLLVSTMMSLGRMASDNEITALKASGVSLLRLAAPIFVFGFIAFIFCLFLSYYLVPAGNHAAKNLMFNVARQKANIGIKEKVFNDDFHGLLIYADYVPTRGSYMERVFICDSRLSNVTSTIVSQRAYVITDKETLAVILRLRDGSVHSLEKASKRYRRIDFSIYDVKLELSSPEAAEKKDRKKTTSEMSVSELKKKLQSGGLNERERRELEIEIYKKLSIPTSCLIFAFIAVPLGIKKHRTGRSRGFVMGLLIVLAYYLLRLGGEALAETGRIITILGVWIPNIVFGVISIYLFVQAVGEKGMISYFKQK
ncbi:MAG: LPS export ABC transporter permease LptF [Syntrophales bacterium]|nr:LPS export ABC transporter permease LptF [Syntrophales bacterium]